MIARTANALQDVKRASCCNRLKGCSSFSRPELNWVVYSVIVACT